MNVFTNATFTWSRALSPTIINIVRCPSFTPFSIITRIRLSIFFFTILKLFRWNFYSFTKTFYFQETSLQNTSLCDAISICKHSHVKFLKVMFTLTLVIRTFDTFNDFSFFMYLTRCLLCSYINVHVRIAAVNKINQFDWIFCKMCGICCRLRRIQGDLKTLPIQVWFAIIISYKFFFH